MHRIADLGIDLAFVHIINVSFLKDQDLFRIFVHITGNKFPVSHAQLIIADTHKTLPPAVHRVTHDCDHWYAIFYCSINGFLQTGFPVVLQNDPVCLGRNTHVHVVQFVIGGSPIRSHDFQKDVVLCRSFPCTCIYSLPELRIRTVHDQVILILIYFFFFFLKTCFFL